MNYTKGNIYNLKQPSHCPACIAFSMLFVVETMLWELLLSLSALARFVPHLLCIL